MEIPEYQTLPSQKQPVPSRSKLGRAALGLIWGSLLLVLCFAAILGVGALVISMILLWNGEWLWGISFLAGLVVLAFAIRFVGKQVEAVGRIRRKDINWGQHFD